VRPLGPGELVNTSSCSFVGGGGGSLQQTGGASERRGAEDELRSA
jgi:hypothetical protein